VTDVPLEGDELLAALDEGGVKFIVVGALAVAAHGFPRATTDLDIVPAPDRENLARLLAVLERIQAKMLPLDIPEHGEALTVEWLADRGNFQFATRYGQLDLLQEVADLTYEELEPKAVSADLGGLRIRVSSYEHLTHMKERAGRDQDVVDLKRLREARGEEG
jgi:hypothetical protein